jgi:predicted nucleotidyltransferase
MEYKPIYQPGFYDFKLDEFDDIFVNSFEQNERRKYLADRLRVYLEKFSELEIKAEIWVDGSYSTHKPEPDDIDILIVFDPNEVNMISTDKHPVLQELFDRDLCKIRYSIDVLLCPSSDEVGRSYWRGWFGFSRDEKAKGIPRFYYGFN